MGIWLELHCDVRAGTITKYNHPGCYSQAGKAPGALVHHTQAGIREGLAYLESRGKLSGWAILGRRYVCPVCSKED